MGVTFLRFLKIARNRCKFLRTVIVEMESEFYFNISVLTGKLRKFVPAEGLE